MRQLTAKHKKTKEELQEGSPVYGVLPPQAEFLQSKIWATAYIGGVGSGKTWVGALKSLNFTQQYPGIHGIVTAPTYKMIRGAVIPTYTQVFGRQFYKRINYSDFFMEMWNGSRIEFLNTSDPDMLRGANVGFVHMDEAALSPSLAWRQLLARLREKVDGKHMPFQIYLTTTPKEFNWVYSEFIAKDRPDYKVWRVKTQDNFFLPPDYYRRLNENYKEDAFKRQELLGEFIKVGGEVPFDVQILGGMYQEASLLKLPAKEYGWLYRFADVDESKRYIIAADAATGQGEDESAFLVGKINTQSIDIVCAGKSKIAETDFGELLSQEGHRYNDALIIVEAAPVGKATLNKLDELHYINIFKTRDHLGWTMMRGKPMMVAELGEYIDNKTIRIPFVDIIEQLMGYAKTEKGSYGASKGARDDYVSALLLLIQGVKSAPDIQPAIKIKVKGMREIQYSYART